MKPSVLLAQEHFRTKVLPRRIEDGVTTDATGKHKRKVYRKAARRELGGDHYPIFDTRLKNMADFGLGVSVYLLQLILIAALAILAGFVMIPAMLDYSKFDEGASKDIRLKGTAACAFEFVEVIGCSGDNCTKPYRESCPLSSDGVIADIAMCCLFTCIFYFNAFVDKVEDKLDEAVQTAQDYSIVVCDPPPDAANPDEFRDFFGRFGRVRNVTIAKKNNEIVNLLHKKHIILRQLHPTHVATLCDILEVPPQYQSNSKCSSWCSCVISILQSIGLMRDEKYWVSQLCKTNMHIDKAMKKTYDTCRVFVSFETEQEQRLCLRELKVSMREAIWDTGVSDERKRFRRKHVLEVRESAEPNNILWKNLELSFVSKKLRFLVAWAISIGVYAVSYYMVDQTYTRNPSYVPLLIGGIDLCLPTIFVTITGIERHGDEDDRQNSLLFKLFGGKILTSVVFVFANSSPVMLLDNSEIARIINIQLSASFVSPCVKALDMYGMFRRYVVAPLLATTQIEMNRYYEGSAFILADRYTEVCKVGEYFRSLMGGVLLGLICVILLCQIMFICLFYSFLVPTGLWIAAVACLTLFMADKFSLLRKTRSPPLLDSTMAKTVRTYTLFALAVHMWITCRFIYSWPFDEVQALEGDLYKQVNKRAPFYLLQMTTQEWQTDAQQSLLLMYRLAAVIVMSTVLYILVVEPVLLFLKGFFFRGDTLYIFFYVHLYAISMPMVCAFHFLSSCCSSFRSIYSIISYCPIISDFEAETAACSKKLYSSITGMTAYCPVYPVGVEEFIIADTSRMLARL